MFHLKSISIQKPLYSTLRNPFIPKNHSKIMQDRILEILMQKDEITWQSIIYDLIKTGDMDPWDIDISILSQKYLEVVKKMQEANLFLSGKVLLASAMLLKIKSERLLYEGIGALDSHLFPQDAPDSLDEFLKEKQLVLLENPKLTIKTPQTRKKRISVNDLITALEKALEVNERRSIRHAERDYIPEMKIPVRKIDIGQLLKSVYARIISFFSTQPTLTFSQLVGSNNREDKILTFIPLLHLSNEERVDLNQKEPFGEIDITLLKNEPLPDEKPNSDYDKDLNNEESEEYKNAEEFIDEETEESINDEANTDFIDENTNKGEILNNN